MVKGEFFITNRSNRINNLVKIMEKSDIIDLVLLRSQICINMGITKAKFEEYLELILGSGGFIKKGDTIEKVKK